MTNRSPGCCFRFLSAQGPRAAVAERRRLVDAFTRAGIAERVYHKEMFFTDEALSSGPSPIRACCQPCMRPRQHEPALPAVHAAHAAALLH